MCACVCVSVCMGVLHHSLDVFEPVSSYLYSWVKFHGDRHLKVVPSYIRIRGLKESFIKKVTSKRDTNLFPFKYSFAKNTDQVDHVYKSTLALFYKKLSLHRITLLMYGFDNYRFPI